MWGKSSQKSSPRFTFQSFCCSKINYKKIDCKHTDLALLVSQLTGVPQDSLVTMVKPGLPTTADLYVLPQDSTPVKRSVFVDKVQN